MLFSIALFWILNSWNSLVVDANNGTNLANPNDPLCGIIAATNIESIYSEWSCTVSGKPVTPPCAFPSNWTGIFCNLLTAEGNVTQIHLASGGITGTLPASIGELTLLTGFYITDNNFYGNLPVTLGELTGLRNLFLDDNSITGTIPSGIWEITFLIQLYVGTNKLTGSIPSSVGSLTRLINLFLDHNLLTGTIPSSIGELTNLLNLFVDNNMLTGSIPDSVGSLKMLVELYVEYNSLVGTIPASIGELSLLTDVHFDCNCLSGTIPSGFGSLTQLRSLLFDINYMTGTLPSGIGSLQHISYFSLYSNMFRGTIPSTIGCLTALTDFYPNDNQFEGPIPSTLSALTGVYALFLDMNSFSGSIPTSIGEMTWLVEFYVADNFLTGPIPTSFGQMLRLDVFDADYNFITGTIPSNVLVIHDLSMFSCSYNHLSGVLPAVTQTNASYSAILSQLELYHNYISGTIPKVFDILVNLQYLALGSNLLTGPIPHLINLNVLEILSLNDNMLSGNVSSSLFPATSLRYMNLSNNMLNGDLNVLTLDSLEVVGLNGNKFTGVIPTDLPITLAKLNLADNLVTGSTPTTIANLPNLQYFNVSSSYITGVIPSELCNSNGISFDVTDTSIVCYSGCLTSSRVIITGASPSCHDGSIMRLFLTVVITGCLLAFVFTVAYNRHLCWCFFWSCADFRGTPQLDSPKANTNKTLSWCKCFESALITVYKLYKKLNTIVSLSFVKLILAVVVTLTTNNWWANRGQSVLIDSCTSPSAGNCFSFCNDVVTTEVTLVNDDITTVLSMWGGSTTELVNHTGTTSFCLAEFNGQCSYDYWLLFNLPPILFHALYYILTCVTWHAYQNFVPQQLQYDKIIAFRYPDVIGEAGEKRGEPIVSREDGLDIFVDIATPLFYNVFPFIEVLTVMYVWGQLLAPPVFCGSARPLSLYYYPIIMSLLDLTKFNIYVSTKLFVNKRYLDSVLALLNFEMFASNISFSFVLAMVFLFGLVREVFGVGKSLYGWINAKVTGGPLWSQTVNTAAGTATVELEMPSTNPMSVLGSGSRDLQNDDAI